jgi:hypothetical protein
MVAFGTILFDDFHSCLKKPAHKTLGFFTVPTGPTAAK